MDINPKCQPGNTDEGLEVAFEAQDGEGSDIIGVRTLGENVPQVTFGGSEFLFRGVDVHSGLTIYAINE